MDERNPCFLVDFHEDRETTLDLPANNEIAKLEKLSEEQSEAESDI
jgi:hypothetical protein